MFIYAFEYRTKFSFHYAQFKNSVIIQMQAKDENNSILIIFAGIKQF